MRYRARVLVVRVDAGYKIRAGRVELLDYHHDGLAGRDGGELQGLVRQDSAARGDQIYLLDSQVEVLSDRLIQGHEPVRSGPLATPGQPGRLVENAVLRQVRLRQCDVAGEDGVEVCLHHP